MDGLPICLTVPILPRGSGREQIHTHDYHELAYVIEGSGWQVTDSARHAVRKGQLYLFPAGVAHAASCDEDQSQLLFVLYVPVSYFASSVWERDLSSAWERILAYGATNSVIDLGEDRSMARAVAGLVETMTREFNEKRPGYGAAVRLRFAELVLLVMRSPWWQTHIPERLASPSPRQLIREAESYIRANWYRNVRVEDLLTVCNTSRSHFHALFRRHTGRTFIAYVNSVRLDQAKTRLRETDRPIGEIAAECGFSRPAYFSSMFREEAGMTPREYRRAVAG